MGDGSSTRTKFASVEEVVDRDVLASMCVKLSERDVVGDSTIKSLDSVTVSAYRVPEVCEGLGSPVTLAERSLGIEGRGLGWALPALGWGSPTA